VNDELQLGRNPSLRGGLHPDAEASTYIVVHAFPLPTLKYSRFPSGENIAACVLPSLANAGASGALHAPPTSLTDRMCVVNVFMSTVFQNISRPSGEIARRLCTFPLEMTPGAKMRGVVPGAGCPR
jgi:hypothetical protein